MDWQTRTHIYTVFFFSPILLNSKHCRQYILIFLPKTKVKRQKSCGYCHNDENGNNLFRFYSDFVDCYIIFFCSSCHQSKTTHSTPYTMPWLIKFTTSIFPTATEKTTTKKTQSKKKRKSKLVEQESRRTPFIVIVQSKTFESVRLLSSFMQSSYLDDSCFGVSLCAVCVCALRTHYTSERINMTSKCGKQYMFGFLFIALSLSHSPSIHAYCLLKVLCVSMVP